LRGKFIRAKYKLNQDKSKLFLWLLRRNFFKLLFNFC
jgi:hypothetical protein